jgi:two-component system alkaline phosphatase synthesis response regulator PhoP
MDKRRALIIEDEINIVELIKYNLESNNFAVDYSNNGEDGYEKILNNNYDILILDLMLPGKDGIAICKDIRKNDAIADLPIIMLTAKSEETDKIIGLELGADDYVTKPFSVKELVARVKSVLRRYDQSVEQQSSDNEEIYTYKDLILNIDKHHLIKDEKVIELTYKEFELLKLLIQNKGRVLSRNRLLDEIWGYDYYGETRTVDVHIRHLRKKLKENSSTKYIKTVRGVGYKVE